ncbi:unnamed protein product [Amoebophrya sp. A25]|nr:unnamed protein product [Amoebophrya sp. A25]|eukprot:GSA25T00018139001.1
MSKSTTRPHCQGIKQLTAGNTTTAQRQAMRSHYPVVPVSCTIQSRDLGVEPILQPQLELRAPEIEITHLEGQLITPIHQNPYRAREAIDEEEILPLLQGDGIAEMEAPPLLQLDGEEELVLNVDDRLRDDVLLLPPVPQAMQLAQEAAVVRREEQLQIHPINTDQEESKDVVIVHGVERMTLEWNEYQARLRVDFELRMRSRTQMADLLLEERRNPTVMPSPRRQALLREATIHQADREQDRITILEQIQLESGVRL